MGALVTLDLPDDSPVLSLPWIITFGPLDDSDEWEPVVCGPYERAHALALAETVVADEELMAVVEPLLPLVDAEAIRDEIELARAAAESDQPAEVLTDDEVEDEWEGRRVEPGPAPTATEVEAGFRRLCARLPGMANSG